MFDIYNNLDSNFGGDFILVPAYGRDYKSKKAVLEDYNDNKDFALLTGRGFTYINKEQITDQVVKFRYNKSRSQFYLNGIV